MIKQFIKDCILFQSKNNDHKFIGIFIWIQLVLQIKSLIELWLK